MADRTVYGGLGSAIFSSVARPPVAVSGVGALFAHAVKSPFGEEGVFGRVLMSGRASSLGVVPVRAPSIFERGDWFKMSWIDAVPGVTKFLDVVKLQSGINRSYQQLPHQTVAKRALPFPVGKGVAIFADRVPKPAVGFFTDGDLGLKSLGKLGNEVHV